MTMKFCEEWVDGWPCSQEAADPVAAPRWCRSHNAEGIRTQQEAEARSVCRQGLERAVIEAAKAWGRGPLLNEARLCDLGAAVHTLMEHEEATP